MSLATGTSTRSAAAEEDTVVEYDIMREAATRLIGAYVARMPKEPSDPAHVVGMQHMIAVRRAARAVPTRDSAEIAAATARFDRELQDLRAR